MGLEAGRFVAALLVACFHFSVAFQNLRGVMIFDMAFRAGHAGVEYFFVLSGFIIYFIHARDMGTPTALRPFLIKRFVRLYPTFWFAWLLMLAVLVVFSSSATHSPIVPGDFVSDILLLPTGGTMLLNQSWSLRHEIVFYAVFAIAIINARLGMVMLVAWQISVLVIGILFVEALPPLLKPAFYIYNVGFGVGIATAWAASHWAMRRPGLLAAVGIVVFVSAMVVEWAIGGNMAYGTLPLGSIASPFIYIGASAMIILGVTRFEMTRPLPGQALLKLLGGSSYALYLIHGLVGSFIIRLFTISALAKTPNAIVFVVMVGAAVGASIAMHLWIEQPMLAVLRRALLKPRGSVALRSPMRT